MMATRGTRNRDLIRSAFRAIEDQEGRNQDSPAAEKTALLVACVRLIYMTQYKIMLHSANERKKMKDLEIMGIEHLILL